MLLWRRKRSCARARVCVVVRAKALAAAAGCLIGIGGEDEATDKCSDGLAPEERGLVAAKLHIGSRGEEWENVAPRRGWTKVKMGAVS